MMHPKSLPKIYVGFETVEDSVAVAVWLHILTTIDDAEGFVVGWYQTVIFFVFKPEKISVRVRRTGHWIRTATIHTTNIGGSNRLAATKSPIGPNISSTSNTLVSVDV
jgi:hypothetical protein